MSYMEALDSHMVRLRYAEGGFSAAILLPVEEGPEALASVISTLPSGWAAAAEAWDVPASRRHVKLSLPRFKLDFQANLKQALQQLGMPTAFEGEESGAFLRMSADKKVRIGTVQVQATLEVNANGTVAAAATGAEVTTRSISFDPPPLEMVVDRPFLFLITDSNDGIVFVAKVVKPSSACAAEAAASDGAGSGGG